MKRDMDLVRKILMVCADHPHGFAPRKVEIEGYSEEAVGYHVFLMLQAGLVKGTDVTTMESSSPEAVVSSITWEGHEFLEASRDEGLWSKAKKAAGATGGLALDVLKSVLVALATQAAKQAAGLP